MTRKTRMPGSNLHVLEKIRWTSRWPPVSDDWICIRQNVTSAFCEKSNLTFAAVFVFQTGTAKHSEMLDAIENILKRWRNESKGERKKIVQDVTSTISAELKRQFDSVRPDLVENYEVTNCEFKIVQCNRWVNKNCLTASFQTLDKRIRHFEAKILKIKGVLDEISQDLNEVSPQLIRIKI